MKNSQYVKNPPPLPVSPHLHDPGLTIKKLHHAFFVNEVAVAQDDPRKIDGKKSISAN